ncbi:MAG: hypothetical protein NZ911_07150 [Sulfolobales archaeon]|nr:hypothetical protein [Sulfolobales archaeon]
MLEKILCYERGPCGGILIRDCTLEFTLLALLAALSVALNLVFYYELIKMRKVRK